MALSTTIVSTFDVNNLMNSCSFMENLEMSWSLIDIREELGSWPKVGGMSEKNFVSRKTVCWVLSDRRGFVITSYHLWVKQCNKSRGNFAEWLPEVKDLTSMWPSVNLRSLTLQSSVTLTTFGCWWWRQSQSASVDGCRLNWPISVEVHISVAVAQSV